MINRYHFLVAPGQQNRALIPELAHTEITALLEEATGMTAETDIKHIIRDPQGDVEKIWFDSATSDGREWRSESTKNDIWLDEKTPIKA